MESDFYDAGDMGCGELLIELRVRMRQLAPGQILRVRATDAGAREDLPAWCRVTRNSLVRQQSPEYWIQRRSERPVRHE